MFYLDGDTHDLVVHRVFLTRSDRGHLYEVLEASRDDTPNCPRTTVCRVVPFGMFGHEMAVVGRTYRTTLMQIPPDDEWLWPRVREEVLRFDTSTRWYTRRMTRLEEKT